jgi:Ca2+/Na+ antiporter
MFYVSIGFSGIRQSLCLGMMNKKQALINNYNIILSLYIFLAFLKANRLKIKKVKIFIIEVSLIGYFFSKIL